MEWQRIIVPLERHFVVYTGIAGVDEGAGEDEGDVFYTGTLFCRDTGIEEGSGWCRRRNIILSTPATGVDEVGQPIEAGRGRFLLAGRLVKRYDYTLPIGVDIDIREYLIYF